MPRSRRSSGWNRSRRRAAAVEPLEPRRLLAPFAVTNTDDSGPGSLRQAILDANANPGADAVDFRIPASTAPDLRVPVPGFDPVSQTWRITLASPLPALTDTIVIDGLSQADTGVPYVYPGQPQPEPTLIFSSPNTAEAREGFDAQLRLIVDGSAIDRAAFPEPTGFVLATDHSNLRGLIITGFAVGVDVPAGPNVGNRIQGNSIGGHFLYFVSPDTGFVIVGAGRVGFEFVNPAIDAAGTRIANTSDGVRIAAPNTTFGGPNPQEANTVTASGGRGVWIRPDAEGSLIQGSQVGLIGPTSTNVFVIAGNFAEGVLVEASSNAIGGPVGGAGNIISANASHGVRLVGAAATRNRVEGNYIGVGPGGGYRFGAGVPGNGGDGVRVEDVPATSIGGPGGDRRNVIGGNAGAGIRLTGPGTVGTVVLNNLVGLVADGDAAIGNIEEGIRIEAGSSFNTVGAGNVVSANLRGLLIAGPVSGDNQVVDSRFGTNLDGTNDLGNTFEGVRIDDSPRNRIIGTAPGATVLSGNREGLVIAGPGATGNLVAGTVIGLDATGNSDLSNARQGVLLDDAPANTIGGNTPEARNLISANHWGVELRSPGAVGNVIAGNFIGTDSTGLLPLGNEVDGVLIRLGASANTVGGDDPPLGNAIAFNRNDGVRIEDQSLGNAILTNSIFENAGLGIRLVPAPAPPGPNRLQPAPTLTAVRTSLALTNIQGALLDQPGASYLVQFFAEPRPDPSGSGEGRRFLGQVVAQAGPDGLATFSADLPGLISSGEFVTATATDAAGDTSPFSAAISEVLGSLQFVMAGFRVDESTGQAIITVVRAGGSGGQATVGYATRGGTAIPEIDYTPVSGTLTFDIGIDAQTFTVPILGDALAEAEETIGLVLGPAAGAATLGSPATAVLTIIDDDQPGLFAFTQTVYAVDQDSGTALIAVARSAGGGTVGITYATAGGSARPGIDYTPVAGMLTFGPGVTLQTFTVPILFAPGLPDGVTVDLALADPTGGAGLGSPNRATLVISRIDGPQVASAQVQPGRGGSRQIVLRFDRPLIAARAVDLRNYGYSVQLPGRRAAVRAPRGFLLGVRSASYDPHARSVTLTTTQPIRPGSRLRLQINQVTDVPAAGVGVAGLDGRLLDGDGDGRPGGAYQAILVAPAPNGRRRS